MLFVAAGVGLIPASQRAGKTGIGDAGDNGRVWGDDGVGCGTGIGGSIKYQSVV